MTSRSRTARRVPHRPNLSLTAYCWQLAESRVCETLHLRRVTLCNSGPNIPRTLLQSSRFVCPASRLESRRFRQDSRGLLDVKIEGLSTPVGVWFYCCHSTSDLNTENTGHNGCHLLKVMLGMLILNMVSQRETRQKRIPLMSFRAERLDRFDKSISFFLSRIDLSSEQCQLKCETCRSV
ncbi:hypothetical protein RRG08_021814 [Elysia crispata]|uniref:Uncharacterized protein n=1 Tax=Elysia crispata TaxID=231223 RepID=A0AAE1DP43_9GAST|nr:hypothetical protein RRG08_021814 [Elysia crispata]